MWEVKQNFSKFSAALLHNLLELQLQLQHQLQLRIRQTISINSKTKEKWWNIKENYTRNNKVNVFNSNFDRLLRIEINFIAYFILIWSISLVLVYYDLFVCVCWKTKLSTLCIVFDYLLYHTLTYHNKWLSTFT